MVSIFAGNRKTEIEIATPSAFGGRARNDKYGVLSKNNFGLRVSNIVQVGGRSCARPTLRLSFRYYMAVVDSRLCGNDKAKGAGGLRYAPPTLQDK
jgi:hypothetical protein